MKQFRNAGQFKQLDISGVRSGKLVALFAVSHKHGSYYWRCKCDCGKESDVMASRIKNSITKSCGCIKFNKGQNEIHGLKKHPLYNKWNSMKQRCYNENCESYPNYGGRGIKVCDRWLHSVENFYNDMNTGYSKGLHLDRIDVNSDYSPSNCRWVSGKQNNNNKRTNVYICMDGRTHTPAEWAEELGIKADTIASRKRKGWTDYEALFGLK